MNWGTSIVLSFFAFAAILGTMVVISMNQQVNLVAEDYYQQEIAYEDQINRLKNAQSLAEPPAISLNEQTATIEVFFPTNLRKDFKDGEIHLFRPSDRRFDVRQEIIFNEGRVLVPVGSKAPGLWRVKVQWSDHTKEYYLEKQIVI